MLKIIQPTPENPENAIWAWWDRARNNVRGAQDKIIDATMDIAESRSAFLDDSRYYVWRTIVARIVPVALSGGMDPSLYIDLIDAFLGIRKAAT